MSITQRAVVTFRVAGFHRWPSAEGERAYLRERHRHSFHIRVELDVYHNERDVEYHDLLAVVRRSFDTLPRASDGAVEFGGMSCEAMAQVVIGMLRAHYPERGGVVEVLEDGEVGTRAHFTPST